VVAVIGFLNQKGGSGKSTLAINVAAELVTRGKRVLLVDTDPQGSVADWSASRGDNASPFAVIRFDRPVLHREIASLAKGYHYVVVDGPARDAALQRSAILSCTLVAVPTVPSGLDLWATQAFLSLLSEAQPFAPKAQKAILVVSRGSTKGVLARGVGEALAGLGLPVIQGTQERLAYREATTAALTIHELADQRAAKKVLVARAAARNEIAALTSSLLES
jgi:chromosome partitioning protein